MFHLDFRKHALAAVCLASVLTGSSLIGCGGGGGGVSVGGGGQTSSAITAVAVSCSPTSIQTGQTSKCTPTVSGTGNFNTSVSWAVSPSSMGSVSTDGVFTAANTGAATVTATSVQDATKSATATVTVSASAGSSVTPTTPMVVPSILLAGQQTKVTVTCFIRGSTSTTQVQLFTLASGAPVLIGQMKDDGQNGDATAGDQVFTLVANLTAPSTSQLSLQVTAASGTTAGGNASVAVPLVQIPSYSSNSDVNQAELQIYNSATQTRSSFANPDWTKPTLLPGMTNNLVDIFERLAGVVNQNTTLQSAVRTSRHVSTANLKASGPHADDIVQSVLDWLTGGLLAPAQNASACNQLVQSLGGFRESATVPVLATDDPELQQFANELAAICAKDNICGGAFTADDFLSGNVAAAEWAHEYVITGKSLPTPIGGCGGAVTTSVANVAVKSEEGQFTDLVGDGLSSLIGAGAITQQLVNQALDTLVGWVVDSSGHATIVVGQAGPTETFSAPAGTYTLSASFGGDSATGTITNTPVYPNSVTNISPSSGENASVTPPSVVALNPFSGPPATPVTITGTGFSTDSSTVFVSFNGGVTAQIASSTTTAIQTTVPAGALSGPINVRTSAGSTTSAVSFAVTGSAAPNPAPSVSSLSPSSLPVGSASQTLTVSGSGFIANSTVTFGGVSHAPTIMSSTELTFTLSATDLAMVGTYSIVVTNPSPGGGNSNSAAFGVSPGGSGTVTITPSSATVPLGGAGTFAATVVGSNGGVTWTIQEGTAGGTLLNSTATSTTYAAPSSTGIFHVKATNADNSSQSAVATVTVVSTVGLTVLHTFDPTQGDGADPVGGLLQATDGNFYGMTYSGGSSNSGSAFKIDSSGNFTTVASFGGTGPGNPNATFMQGSDGNLYGTSQYGGSGGRGTFFKMDTSGTVTVLHSFTDADQGANPYPGVTQATDGNFYGTTFNGGTANAGTAFKVDASGNLTFLHSFSNSEGDELFAGLIQATDGNFYGTAYFGGSAGGTGAGTIYKMDSTGTVTVVHSFSFSPSDGQGPFANLIQAADGFLYGTTVSGGAHAYGTVFKTDIAGNLTVLHSFSGQDGVSPHAPLTQGTDGSFYGTTSAGGSFGQGTLFRMDALGNVTVLHSFSNADAGQVTTGVIQGADGNLYGTGQGGSKGSGIVFRLDLSTFPTGAAHTNRANRTSKSVP